MRIRNFIVWFVILVLVTTIGCDRKTRVGKVFGGLKLVSLAEINDNPAKYLNKECIVSGYVTTIEDIPILKNDFFKIFDGTDEIRVITNRGVPPLGMRVIMKGILRGFGGKPISVTIPLPILYQIQFKTEWQYVMDLKELDFFL